MIQHQPAISIIIPLYNKRDVVERALRSVLAQGRRDLEVVVVDDGSTDGGAGAVTALGDARIRVIQQSNAGVSAARNRGIAESHADLLAFLDADDEWLPHFLDTIVAMRQEFPCCDVFATAYVLRDQAGSDHRAVLRGLHPSTPTEVIGDYFTVACRSDPPIHSSAVAVNRKAIQAVGGFPLGIRQGEDLLTWSKLAARYQIAYCKRPLAVFWQPEFNSGVPTRRPEVPDLVGKRLRSLLATAPPALRQGLTQYIGHWHEMRGAMFLGLGDYPNARREFLIARRFAPIRPTLYAKSVIASLPPEWARNMYARWTRLRRCLRS